MKRNLEFIEEKLLEYGFQKADGNYVLELELDDSHSLIIIVDENLSSYDVEVVDSINGEKYLPFELSKNDYVMKLKEKVKSLTNEVLLECTNPRALRMKVIVPAQIDDIMSELKDVERMIESKQKELDLSVLNREMKASNWYELGNVLDHRITEDLAILKERRERLEYELNVIVPNEYRYATPEGDMAQIGSLVTIKRYQNGKLGDREIIVLLIDGNVSEKTKALYPYKFADVNIGMGKALEGHSVNDDVEFEVSVRGNKVVKNKVRIVSIDQEHVYAEYDYLGINPIDNPKQKTKTVN